MAILGIDVVPTARNQEEWVLAAAAEPGDLLRRETPGGGYGST